MLKINILNIYFFKSFFFKHLVKDIIFFLSKILVEFTGDYKTLSLPFRIKKFTVIKSPFVSKKSREQFEIRVYKNIVAFDNISFKNIKGLSNYVKHSHINLRIKHKVYKNKC